jgi:prepilin-type N-terminal cleavage/methylation domain-containing protein
MTDRQHNGFTIIELMLVLAISGSLVAAIFVGSSTAINQQRYRDSVNSLKSFIQNQYDQVSNTLNDRTGTEGCTSTATITATPQSRGTSDCVIMGRLVTLAANGVDLSAVDVVGYRASNVIVPPATTDLAELRTYRLGVSSASPDTDTVAWGAKVVSPNTTNAYGFSMLIVRSPQSGSIMTFTAPGGLPAGGPLTLVTAANNTAARDLCVNPGGFSLTKRMEVKVGAAATSQGDIQIPLESTSICN